jgi:tRNA threonylcarbamoyladenosine biosynthesis protein TsaB
MLILSVDTSTRMGSAALLRDGKVLAEVSGYEETPYSTRLFRDVEQLQDRVNFSLHEVDLFAVASGPGSFTGLRVGLTAVKAWAEVHQKPVAAISGLEAIADESQTVLTRGTPSTTTSTTNPRYIVPFLDARRRQIFGAVYGNVFPGGANLSLESDESILSPDEFLDMVKGKVAGSSVDFVSPTPEAISAARIAETFPGARVIPVSAALAPAIGRLGFERAKRGEVLDAIRLDANYVRRSDAEAAWKDR